MSGLPIIQPGESGEKLATELERFSFGAAVSPMAEVTPFEGPANFVKTVVKLGGISIEHAQLPENMQQNIVVTGEEIPARIASQHFMFDTHARLLMVWREGHAGPMPIQPEITNELADTIQKLNDRFEQQA